MVEKDQGGEAGRQGGREGMTAESRQFNLASRRPDSPSDELLNIEPPVTVSAPPHQQLLVTVSAPPPPSSSSYC